MSFREGTLNLNISGILGKIPDPKPPKTGEFPRLVAMKFAHDYLDPVSPK